MLVLSFVGTLTAQRHPMVIAHRGAMGYEMENTLPAIQKALDLQAEAIEIDVFRIRTGEIVVFHDEDLKKLTNTKGSIEGMSWEQLQKVVVNGGHRIPKLKEVLDLIDGKCTLNIELKGAGTAVAVWGLMQEAIAHGNWKLDQFIVSSFKWNELRDMRAQSAIVPIGILPDTESIPEILSIAKEVRATAIHPYHGLLDEKIVSIFKKEGYKLYVWTVNKNADIQKMKDLGVDGIITNYPDRVH